MSLLGQLAVQVVGDLTGIKKSFKELNTEVDKTGSSLGSKIAAGAKLAAGGILAIGSAAVAGATALMAVANQAGAYAEEIEEMAARTGLAKGTLQEMKYVTDQVGVSFGALETATLMLGKKVAADDKELIKLVGTTRKANGTFRDMSDIFPAVINKMAAMTDKTKRNALAMEIFGKGGGELIPLFDLGAKGLDQMSKKARELGLVMSDEGIAALGEYKDTMDALKMSVGGIFRGLALEFLPIVLRVLKVIQDNMPAIQRIIKSVFSGVGKLITWLADVILPGLSMGFQFFVENVMPLLEGLWNFITGLFASGGRETTSEWSSVWYDIKEIVQAVWGIIKGILNVIKAFWAVWGDEITATVKVAWNIISGTIKAALKVVTNIVKLALALLTGDWKGAGDAIADIVTGIFDWLKTQFNGLIDLAFTWGKGLITGFWDGLKSAIGGVKTWVKENVGGLLGGLNPFSKESAGGISAGGVAAPAFAGVPSGIATGFQAGPISAAVKHEHAGTITVKGVTDEGGLIGATKIVMDELGEELEQENRRVPLGLNYYPRG